jgi:hypothetical protein
MHRHHRSTNTLMLCRNVCNCLRGRSRQVYTHRVHQPHGQQHCLRPLRLSHQVCCIICAPTAQAVHLMHWLLHTCNEAGVLMFPACATGRGDFNTLADMQSVMAVSVPAAGRRGVG